MWLPPECPKCKSFLIQFNYKEDGSTYRVEYKCLRCYVDFEAPSCVWIIDGIKYTEQEVERYKRLRAFI
jgi:hypothetical protein